MTNRVGNLVAALVIVSTSVAWHSPATQAALLAGWDFQTTTNGGTAVLGSPNTPTLFNANVGSGTLFLNGSEGSSNWLQASELSGFSGSSINATNGLSSTTTSPAALAVLGGTSQAANGNSMVFKFDMTGLQNLSTTFSAQRTGTGFDSQVWETSVDGTNWSAWGTFAGGSTSGTIQSSFSSTGVLSLAATSALDNASNAYVRITFSGASTSSGNNRLDNFQFDAAAVPEPSTMALGGVGLVLAAAAARRRQRVRPSQAGGAATGQN